MLLQDHVKTTSENVLFDEKLPVPIKTSANASVVADEASMQKAKEVEDVYDAEVVEKKLSVQLQRIMAEVVIYPEYNELEKLKRRWQTIHFNPSDQVVTMLIDMEPKIATKTELVLSTYNKSLANQLKSEPNLSQAETFIADLMGKELKLIITDEKKWLEEREVFAAKWKANEVDAQTIDELSKDIISLEEEAAKLGYEYVTLFDDETDEALGVSDVVKDAKELFGDIVIVEE